MSKYHDDTTKASDPGCVKLSLQKFYQIWPYYKWCRGWRLWLRRTFLQYLPVKRYRAELKERIQNLHYLEDRLNEHLQLGDSRAAIVISLQPLLVAAYTDEIDCITMLLFPSHLAKEHNLRIGSPLLTINTYRRGDHIVNDLDPGPRTIGRYINVYPVIADFISPDKARIEARKKEISQEEWLRCLSMGKQYRKAHPQTARSGFPFMSDEPAK